MQYIINDFEDGFTADIGCLKERLVEIANLVNQNEKYPQDFSIESIHLFDKGMTLSELSKEAVEQANDFITPYLIEVPITYEDIDWETVTDNWEN